MKHWLTAVFFTLSLLAAALPASAATMDVEDALDHLINHASASGGGFYTSATRNVYVGGSVNVWLPRGSTTFVTLAPPHIAAGCGGISMYFGGFSFINATQFKNMIKKIMQNALGYAIQIGIQTLCPQCHDILVQLQKLSRAVAQGSINSCHMAKMLVNKGMSMISGPNPVFKGVSGQCSATATSTGYADSMADAMNGICNGVTKAVDWVSDKIRNVFASGQTQKAKQLAAENEQQGNTLWKALTLAGYANTWIKELFIAMYGFESTTNTGNPDKSQRVTSPGWDNYTDQPVMLLLKIMMYGTKPGVLPASLPADSPLGQMLTTTARIQLDELPYYVCMGRDNSGNLVLAPNMTPLNGASSAIPNLMMCNATDPSIQTVGDAVTAGVTPLLTPDGLIVAVWEILWQALVDIQNGHAIQAQAIKLMQLSPLPVYRMLNVAAVFPSVARQMVTMYSEYIAFTIAEAVIFRWLRTPDKIAQSLTTPTAAELNDALSDLMEGIQATVEEYQIELRRELQFQQSILAQLERINAVMYQSLAGSGIQGNLLFSQGLVSAMAIN